MVLSEAFWDNKYKSGETGWDIGYISTPLKKYFDQLKNKELKILIPGGGNSYEAEYLHKLGFKNVYVVDISSTVLINFQKRVPSFPNHHLIKTDFFGLKDSFELIIEQTFFCAIHPSLRPKYASKMSDKGFDLVPVGSDHRSISAGAKSIVSEMKGPFKKEGSKTY